MTGDRVVIITGASSGIGAEAAAELATQGNRVAVVGRNPERTAQVAERVGAEAFVADFDRLDEVHALADRLLDRFERIDVLANNAGGIVGSRASTADGHERTIQSNHFAPFLLTKLLLPRLIASASPEVRPRVVSTSSVANRMGSLRIDDLDWTHRAYVGGWRPYGTAKLATNLFISELAERLVGSGVDAYAFHPGAIATRFGSDFALMRVLNSVTSGRWASSPAEGAAPLVALAADVPVRAPSGTYFDRLTPHGAEARQAQDAGLGRELWAASEEVVAGWAA